MGSMEWGRGACGVARSGAASGVVAGCPRAAAARPAVSLPAASLHARGAPAIRIVAPGAVPRAAPSPMMPMTKLVPSFNSPTARGGAARAPPARVGTRRYLRGRPAAAAAARRGASPALGGPHTSPPRRPPPPRRAPTTPRGAGGGVAGLLVMHYRARYPSIDVRAWCYAPPGGLLSPGASAALEDCCHSLVSSKVREQGPPPRFAAPPPERAAGRGPMLLAGRSLPTPAPLARATFPIAPRHAWTPPQDVPRMPRCSHLIARSQPHRSTHSWTNPSAPHKKQDMIPRMSLWTVELLRAELMQAALRCKVRGRHAAGPELARSWDPAERPQNLLATSCGEPRVTPPQSPPLPPPCAAAGVQDQAAAGHAAGPHVARGRGDGALRQAVARQEGPVGGSVALAGV